MRFKIRQNVARIIRRRIRWLCLDIFKNELNISCSACNKSRLALGSVSRFQFISELIREYSNTVCLIHPGLSCTLAFKRSIGNISAKCVPAFTRKYRIRIDFDCFIVGILNGFIGCIAHHIPTHTINLIFLKPIFYGINHQLLSHLMIGRKVIAEAPDIVTILILPSVIIRNNII
ncbi:hypothetical protein D3C80_1420740 [compost metagenome]